MKKISLPLLVVAAMLASSGAASASVAGVTSSYALNFRVIDLTPNDGVAAGYSLRWTRNSGSAWAGRRYGDNLFNDSFSHDSMQADSLSGNVGDVTLTASSGPAGGGVSVDFPALTSVDADAGAYASSSWSMILAPHTALVVTGRYDIALDVDRHSLDPKYINAKGVFSLSASAGNNGEAGTYIYGDYMVHGDYSWDEGALGNAFSFTLANTGGTGIDAYIDAYASADAHKYTGVPLPVPEPSTWAMLGAGLLAIGCRRKLSRRS